MAGERKRPSRARKADAAEVSPTTSSYEGERELIVVARHDMGLRATADGVASVTGADVSGLAEVLEDEGATLHPLFGGEERVMAAVDAVAEASGFVLPDLSVYYRVDAPDTRLEALAERLRGLDEVEAAYVKPPAEPAQELNDMVALAEQPPTHTPDFTARQGYLNAAPEGIDARYAWTQSGG